MSKKILAVDHDILMLYFIRDVLFDNGYDVVCAESGSIAMQMLEERQFDCIIMEFYLPDKDALDIVSSMYDRDDRSFPGKRIVIARKGTPYHAG